MNRLKYYYYIDNKASIQSNSQVTPQPYVNQFSIDSKYQLALRHGSMPLSLFGFSALDAENWKLIEENFPVPIFNKQQRNPRETSSGYRRVKGIPSSARAVFPPKISNK